MSVSPDIPALPKHRVPVRYIALKPNARGRHDDDVCWRMSDGPFADGKISDRLVLRVDASDHGIIEPA
ncbi:MAG: hypothetical protein ACREJM_02725, partial [Candidatus Saccharimonadales bacterium]